MNKDDLETFTTATRELLAAADEPKPDTIAIPDTPAGREVVERLGLQRGSSYRFGLAALNRDGWRTPFFVTEIVRAGVEQEQRRARERFRKPQQVFDRADYSKLVGQRFDLGIMDDLKPRRLLSREGVKTYPVKRVDDRWTVSSEGKSGEQVWREIDAAIAREPEVVGVTVAVRYRISAATLAFCVGGCILHEESET